ncbi:MAG TPA: hypothetical protein VJ850_09975 [Candidatus Limnocylindrales bacterium]|nr:hypothetical protein [Candidatus Limnocylindrales bacterium]
MLTRTLDIDAREELAAALEPLRAGSAGGALILIGGADFTDPEMLSQLRAFFAQVAVHCEATAVAVVDGGTDTGVMRLIAEARAAASGTFPLAGVAPRGAFGRLTRTGAPIEPARDHDLVLKVPGERFGDETEWLFSAADELHGGVAPALVVNGGHLARHEANVRLAEGGVVIAVEGSGRAADELASALHDDPELRASGRLRTIPLTADAAGLAGVLAG